ncbi:spermidine coumaroyl-CoA acyltransferase [Cynara cardunculus var. scolymus]|uniref:Chloramphenicol acetyltransferase-like domain-containing protein n=1 Tax=Cynara cardunculus var. scolymus TaxID=59895 RepID=A0A103XUA1_CYNCS|nr:spermidine coumaroyl-CoA acyltransferase [Cynara cardunculus var. scolymus]KVH97037.1 Chloramphenicol acetyltransferase-like domain-containing protein [Cynara cardunculus var. scolymus]
MDVKISQPTTVYPSQQPFTDDHILPLSHLDTDRNMNVPFRYVRAYAAANHHHPHPFDVITVALSTALVKYYPYTGSLHRRKFDGRFELHCKVGGGVTVIPATVDSPLSSVSYLDDADEEFIELLVPNPDQQTRLTHPLMLQVTRFSCGGYTLGASVHHVLCDGLGATLFFNAMAELARGAGEVTVEPVWDRSKLLGPREPARIVFPIEEVLCLDKDFVPYSELDEKVVRECFHVKDEWLDRFKILLQERSGLSFTTFEALGAFLWQARVKASKFPREEKVKFAYAINIRKLVKPPLPAGYWGNGCVPMYVQLTAGELTERPIWETAEMIKKSKRNATNEYVHSFIDFQELNYEKGINAGKRVSAFTDWRHLGHSTVDFGWGGPVTVIPLSRNLLGSVEPCFFLPYSEASQGKKDGFKVLLYLQANAVIGFRGEMEKFGSMEYA